MLELYGHPFSSYTWKVLIALYANGTPFTFHSLDGENPDQATAYARVQQASPMGKFPVLVDGGQEVFETTAIIEHLALHHSGVAPLIPADPDDAIRARMIDRVFDNYVMNAMQECVDDAIRNGSVSSETQARVAERVTRAYRWIEGWLATYAMPDSVSVIECAAAPALFYADWVTRIPEDCPRLRGWRAQLLAMAPVARCVEDARRFRHYFPLGAPDRD
jgi:glutathione S-transferase